ncbi:MAG: UDP-N-acetylmuramoyl-L-alanine--D-glutamate ligase [Fusobacterium sp.]|nr:UDP-N-acetylmuramoyl-L-alanine--D-glutamate ligase [Fusobacterium sp.]
MKKVMIYGNGLSGRGAKKLLEKENYEVILVDDKTAMSSQEAINYLDSNNDIEFFIKSPGIPYNKLVQKVKEKKIEILDEVELVYNYMQEKNINTKIIAITGTNGKSTTTAKMSELLSYAGYKSAYAGNIGVSFSETILNAEAKGENLDYIALELSSFQLENIKEFKPYIALIVNLGPDHIERYSSFDEYYDTKFNISTKQNETEFFIENIDDKEIVKRENLIKGNIVKLSKKTEADIYSKDGKIYWKKEYLMETSELSLKGEHNLENMLYIIAVAKIIGVDNKKIKEFLKQATPLEHRTENFFSYGKVKFINDSKATNVDSTKVALESYKDCILICGGYDKGVDLKPLATLIKENTKEVYLIGVIAEQIKKLLLDINYDKNKIFNFENIENTLKELKVKLNKEKEEVILLSPATSSYDQFKSFEHRGKFFKEEVVKIFG